MWSAGGSAGGKRSPGPARRRGGSHGARARGAQRSPARSGPAPLSALPGARPSPAGSTEVGPPSPCRSAPAAVAQPAPRRSSLRGAGQSAGAAPTREAAQLRRPGAAAAAPAAGCGVELQLAPRGPTWTPAPARDASGARRGGAGQGGAEAPARVHKAPPPGSPVPDTEGANGDLPEQRAKPRNFWPLSCRRKNGRIGSATRRRLPSVPRAGCVWKLKWRQGCLRDSWSRVADTTAFEALADVGNGRPLN